MSRKPTWSPDQIKTLKLMLDQCRLPLEIAAATGKTRFAVYAKTNELKLKKDWGPSSADIHPQRPMRIEEALARQPQPQLDIVDCRVTVTVPGGKGQPCDALTGIVRQVNRRWFRVEGKTDGGRKWTQCWHWSQIVTGEIVLKVHGRKSRIDRVV